MIMRYYGIDGVEADKDYIYKYISPNKLTSGFEIEDYARRHGFKVQVLRDRKYDRIKWLLSQNYPLLVFGEIPRGGGHYVVLSGYNEKSFYINDPYPGRLRLWTYRQFRKFHSSTRYRPGPFYTLWIYPRKKIEDKGATMAKPLDH